MKDVTSEPYYMTDLPEQASLADVIEAINLERERIRNVHTPAPWNWTAVAGAPGGGE